MNKLQRIEEMEKQLAALRAEVEQEAKPKQWEPKDGDWYYASHGKMQGVTNKKTRDFGIERKTEEQAEADYKLARAYNRLLAYKAEFDADFVEVWGGKSQNYFVCFDSKCKSYGVDMNSIFKGMGVVYMSELAAKDLCDKLNSGEVVL